MRNEQQAQRRVLTFLPQILPLLAALSVAACDSTTEPLSSPFDASLALADYQAMETVFASDGWTSFQALGRRSPLSSAAAMGAISAMHELQSGTHGRAFALNLFREISSQRRATGTFTEPVISPMLRGKTLVYNAGSDEYEIDTSRTGAPTNGTRFILYRIGANDQPDVAHETGYADLLDEGANAGSAIVLRLIAVQQSTTVLDYRVRFEPQGTGGAINVSGFVADEHNARVDFTIDVAGTTSGGQTFVDLDFALSMAPRNFEIAGTVQGVEGDNDGAGTVHLRVQHGDKTLQVDMTGESGALNGTIRLNGNPFVTVSGQSATPVLRNALGQPLNGRELLMVLHVVDITEDVFALVEDLLRPADNLIVLGWIL